LPSFSDHVKQFSQNLHFLEGINGHFPDQFDWQVTVCFYAALHLMNAHLAKFGMQYRTHSDVTGAINPENATSIMKVPEDPYVAYISLLNLSRRARYLINVEEGRSETARFTYDKHLAKAVKNLDVIVSWFANQYPEVKFEKIKIKCIEIKQTYTLNYFQKVK
jgi:hypothetical protein